jgi:hypothetical protein
MPNGPWHPPAGQPFGGPGCIGNVTALPPEGGGLRLWAIRLPADIYVLGKQMPTITATGYNAAGLAVALS